MTDDVNTYLYGCVSLLVPECVGYLSVYVCKTHTKVVLVLRYQGIHNIIKRNNTSNVARSPIQSKKQDIKNRSGGEGWRQQERGVGQNLLGQAIKRGLYNIEGVRNPLPTMTHKELFWKKDVLIVQKKSLKSYLKDFHFSKVAGQKPAVLQKMSSIAVVFEEICSKFQKHIFHRIHLSSCLLKLYYSQHCLIEVLQDFDIYLDLVLLREALKVW